jgi:hypothetical protein
MLVRFISTARTAAGKYEYVLLLTTIEYYINRFAIYLATVERARKGAFECMLAGREVGFWHRH